MKFLSGKVLDMFYAMVDWQKLWLLLYSRAEELNVMNSTEDARDKTKLFLNMKYT